MTPQTAQQWIEQADLIQCDRYHARITESACEAFQDRHDSSEMGMWKHGEYSNCPTRAKDATASNNAPTALLRSKVGE